MILWPTFLLQEVLMYLQLYVIRPAKATEFGENYAAFRAVTPFKLTKVNEFGTNQKLICYFLLVINSNLYLAPFPRYSVR